MRTLEEVLEDFFEVFGAENIHVEKADNGFPLFAITATED